MPRQPQALGSETKHTFTPLPAGLGSRQAFFPTTRNVLLTGSKAKSRALWDLTRDPLLAAGGVQEGWALGLSWLS